MIEEIKVEEYRRARHALSAIARYLNDDYAWSDQDLHSAYLSISDAIQTRPTLRDRYEDAVAALSDLSMYLYEIDKYDDVRDEFQRLAESVYTKAIRDGFQRG